MKRPPAISIDIQILPNSNQRKSHLMQQRSTMTTGVFTREDKSSALQESPISRLNAILTDMKIFKRNSVLRMMLGFKLRIISIKLDLLRVDFITVREVQSLNAVRRAINANAMVWFSIPPFKTMVLNKPPQLPRWTSLNLFNGHSDRKTQETTISTATIEDSAILLQVEKSNAGAKLQSQESHSHAVRRVKTADAQAEERSSMELLLPQRTLTPPSKSSLKLHTL